MPDDIVGCNLYPALVRETSTLKIVPYLASSWSGQSTFGFIETHEKPHGVQSTVIGHDRLVLVVPNGHPWARRRSPVALDQLARTPLIAREETSETRKQVDRILADQHPVPPVYVLRGNAAVRIAVIAGMGPAITSALTVADCVRRGELTQVALPAGPWARYLRALWPRTAVLDPQARRLISIARRSSSLLQTEPLNEVTPG